MEGYLVYSVLLLINSWLLQGVVGTDCTDAWNYTLEHKEFTLRWSGADRFADVEVNVLPLKGAIACPKLELLVPFMRKMAQTTDVCANTDYSVNLLLVCPYGDKHNVDSISWRLEQELFAPTNLTATEVTNTSASLTWEAPPHPVVQYEVMKSRLEGFNTQDTDHVAVTSHEMSGLVAYTRYYVMVRGRTEVAIGPWTTPLTFVTDVGVPFQPLRVRATDVTDSSIAVAWDPPYPSTGPVLWYTIAWRPAEAMTSEYAQVNDTAHNLTSLLPYTQYFAWVRATTSAGDGTWSSSLDTWTGIGVPSEPRNLTALNITSTDISVGWEVPDPPNGPILGYVVSWSASGATVSQVMVNDTYFDTNELVPYTQYSFQVAARTEVGLGPYTSRLTVRTDIDIPSAPRNLKATEVRNTSANLEWDEPERPNGPLLGYFVWCSPKCNDIFTNETAVLMSGLRPFTQYEVQVVAVTEAGESPSSDPFTFRTEMGVPHPLYNVTVSEVTPTRILITWVQSEESPNPTEDVSIAWGVVGTTASQVSTLEHHYEAVGLRPYTEYSFLIAPRNKVGHGLAHILRLRTAIAAPASPQDVSVLETTETSALLQWFPPEHPNGPHLGYLVQWSRSSAPFLNGTNGESWTNSNTFRIENLDHTTNYSMRVAANTSAGQGPWSSDLLFVTKAPSGGKSSLILGLTLGIVLPLIVLFVLLAIYVARRKDFFKFLENTALRKSPKKQQTNETPNSVVHLEVINPISASMTVFNFAERMKTRSREDLIEEFEELQSQSPVKSCNEAKLEPNLTKNRWAKILPFDYSRVKLLPNEGEIRSNFINASYIPGSNHLLEYIATQGPLPNTIDDMWRLVWQEGVPLVVMLTQCVERAVKNCEQYWPSTGQSKLFGDIQVQNVSESILTSYVQRTFTLQHQSQKRQVVQMHFTNWPVSGSPRSADEFLHFTRKVREHISERLPGPILVHCNAGVGRTGTFIAVDRLLQSLQDSNDIDIFGTVLDMRRHRPHMVHTEDQYVFIYSCIERLLEERNTQEDIYELLSN